MGISFRLWLSLAPKMILLSNIPFMFSYVKTVKKGSFIVLLILSRELTSSLLTVFNGPISYLFFILHKTLGSVFAWLATLIS